MMIASTYTVARFNFQLISIVNYIVKKIQNINENIKIL